MKNPNPSVVKICNYLGLQNGGKNLQFAVNGVLVGARRDGRQQGHGAGCVGDDHGSPVEKGTSREGREREEDK